MSVRHLICAAALVALAASGCSRRNQNDGVKVVAPDAVLADTPSATDVEEAVEPQPGGPLASPPHPPGMSSA